MSLFLVNINITIVGFIYLFIIYQLLLLFIFNAHIYTMNVPYMLYTYRAIFCLTTDWKPTVGFAALHTTVAER